MVAWFWSMSLDLDGGENIINPFQDSWCPGWETKWGPAEYNPQALLMDPMSKYIAIFFNMA